MTLGSTELKIKIVKTVAAAIAGTGVQYVVKDILVNNVSVPETRWQTAKLFIGSAAILGMAGAATDTFVEGKIDGYVARIQAVKNILGEDVTNGSDESAG